VSDDPFTTDDPTADLFCAVRWADRLGLIDVDILAKLRSAHRRGADVNARTEDGDTPLTAAVAEGMGAPEAVALLLELGADPAQADGDGHTPWSLCALRLDDSHVTDRMTQIRDHLQAAGADRFVGEAKAVTAASATPTPPVGLPDHIRVLYEHGTDAANYDLDTDAICRKLMAWHETYGIVLSEVGPDRLVVAFSALPDETRAISEEIYAFCPDVVDQGFGTLDDVVAAGRKLPRDVAELIDGIDFDEPDFGLIILARSLARTRRVALWWD